jgi:HEPN domain-containing protein/predicted nucleotidyltransferase
MAIKTIDDAVNLIVKEAQPERVILFGSFSKDSANRDSDLDILVIKETDKRPIDRRIEIERLFPKRDRPLDIFVYTPKEINYLFSIGSPFINEILQTGRVVYMRKIVEDWVRLAEDEYSDAVILYEHSKYKGACYHAQQCVEKSLKALILEKGGGFKKIHDIVKLIEIAGIYGWQIDVSIDDAVFLNSIYKGRYPAEEGLLPFGEPTMEDAKRAVEQAEKMVTLLRRSFKDKKSI